MAALLKNALKLTRGSCRNRGSDEHRSPLQSLSVFTTSPVTTILSPYTYTVPNHPVPCQQGLTSVSCCIGDGLVGQRVSRPADSAQAGSNETSCEAMADEIDPRLRALGDGGNPTFAQQSRNPYNNPLSQLPVPPHQASEPSNTSSLRNTQNHTFYPALPTTPQSFYPGTHPAVNSTASQYDEGDQGSTDQPHSGPGQYTPEAGADSNTARSRACEACRSLKVRCEPDPVNPEGTCKRCGKAGRQCVVTVPNRKRQKKTDSRVAELEKKIDALQASLHATRDHNPGQRSDSGVEIQPSAYPPPDQPQSIADVNRDGWMGQVPGGQDGVFRQSMRGVPTPPILPGLKRKRSQEMGNYAYALQTGNLMASPTGTIGKPLSSSLRRCRGLTSICRHIATAILHPRQSRDCAGIGRCHRSPDYRP
jgi:hypothetical protein